MRWVCCLMVVVSCRGTAAPAMDALKRNAVSESRERDEAAPMGSRMLACAQDVSAAFRPLLERRDVRHGEPMAAAFGVIVRSSCGFSEALRGRASGALEVGERMYRSGTRYPEESFRGLRFSSVEWIPHSEDSALVADAAAELLGMHEEMRPVAQAFWAMAHFSYKGRETQHGVDIVGDVLLGTLAPGCGYLDSERCGQTMRWDDEGRARVRRWYDARRE